MDSFGGWVANPVELLKILVRVDGFSNVPDILSPEPIRVMTTRSRARNSFALGWHISQSNSWSHGGSMPGTRAMMVRRADGFNVAMITNYRPPEPRQEFESDWSNLFTEIQRAVRTWPAGTEL